MFLEKLIIFLFWCGVLGYIKNILHKKLYARLGKSNSNEKAHYGSFSKFNTDSFWNYNLNEIMFFFPWFVLINTGEDFVARGYKLAINILVSLIYGSLFIAVYTMDTVAG
ncbi:hypothetical protein [Fulvivirga ligni]|uniref:hypothetical protein n=1 Tax=Fulvivirga ligni TaxID=2904246 RepID=UPI001F32CC16|nr:hypothetical protein [Fulvivirga ligni]UII19688.1 hypothetical protein LVD16_17750 [Fulvivirga ligni]